MKLITKHPPKKHALSFLIEREEHRGLCQFLGDGVS